MDSSRNSWLRTFLVIFVGQAFSLLGSAALNFALVWWITAETGSAAILSYTAIASVLPQALLGLVIGPFIDRWDRRLTMIVADMYVAATSVILILLFFTGGVSSGTIIVIIMLRSIGAGVHTPASQAAVPMYVPSEHLMQVAGWNFFLGSGVAMAAPIVGALLIGVAPIAVVAVLDVAGALLAVAALAIVHIPHPCTPERESGEGGIIREFVEGWHELTRHSGLFALTLIVTVITFLYMPLSALFSLLTLEQFGGGAFEWSLAELAFGAGMLVGSSGIAILSSKFPETHLIGTGIVFLGLMLGLSGLLPSSAFWMFVAFCVLMGISAPMFGAPLTAMLQRLIEPSKLGRVMSLFLTMALIASPAGLLVAGSVAERVGIDLWFSISGSLIVAAGILVWVLPAVQNMNEDTANQ